MVEMRDGRSVDRVGTALAWGGLVALLYLVYLIVEPFLIALGWASVLAVVFYPAHERIAQRFGPGRAAVLSTLAVTLIVVVPLVVVTIAFAREAYDAVNNVQRVFAEGRFGWMARAWDSVEQRLPESMRVDVASLATDAATGTAGFLVTQSGLVLRNLAGFALNLGLALFATFFLLRDSASIMRVVRRLLPMDDVTREETLARTRELISVGVVSAGVVAAVQGFLGGVIFAALGIDGAVFWGVVMTICCLLPFGAWVVWLPAAIVLAAGGAVGRAIILAALGFGVVSAADNVLRPWLLSGRSHLNGLVILLGLLGGIGVFGMLGIVLGPVVVATALGLLEGYVNSKASPRV